MVGSTGGLARHAPSSLLGMGALLFTLCLSSLAAAKTVVVKKTVEGSADAFARAAIQRRLERFGVRKAGLRLERRIALPKGEVLRYQQVHQGLPVLGRGVSALLHDGTLVLLTGKLAPMAALSTTPRVGREQAIDAFKARFPTAKVSSVQLALRPSAPARLVWQLRAGTLVPPDSWRALVDAQSGELMHALSMRVAAEGWAYTPNPITGELAKVTLARLDNEDVLEGKYANVQRCSAVEMSLECDRLASPTREEGFLWAQPEEPSVSDAFSEVHTYYHVDAFHQWLKDRFGFSRPGGKEQIDVYVNFSYQDQDGQIHGISNAFFGDVTGDGRGELIFGQARRDFAYDGDVIYHEFTHSVIAETSLLEPEFDELGFNEMPLALNEAFADLMSSAFTGDGNVGEYAGGSYGGMSIRDLGGELMRCPDDLIGESHNDGLIFGRLAWAVREQVPSKRVFDEVIYTTMISLHSTAEMDDAIQALSATAGAIVPGAEKLVEQVIAKAGLGAGCKRLVPLEPESVRRGYMNGAAIAPGLGYVPAGVQYRIDVPADATKLTIALRTLGWHGAAAGEHQMGAFVRRDEPVAFDGKLTVRDITMTEKEPTVDLTADDAEHLLVPGASYYVLPLNIAVDDIAYEVSVAFERAPAPDAAAVTPDAGVIAADQGAVTHGDKGGSSSGCAVGAPSGASGPTLLLLALVGLVRRRRARR